MCRRDASSSTPPFNPEIYPSSLRMQTFLSLHAIKHPDGMLGHVCSGLDLNPAIFVGCVRMGVFNSLELLMRYLSGISLNKEQYCFFPRDTPFSYSTKELSAISKSRHLPNMLSQIYSLVPAYRSNTVCVAWRECSVWGESKIHFLVSTLHSRS